MKTLDELDRLHAAATAGPWEVSDRVDFWSVRAAEGETAFDDGSVCDEYRAQCSVPTRDAIVALHNAWPAISARLRAAEAEVERLRGLCGEAAEHIDPMRWGHGTAGERALVARLDRAALGEP